MATTVTTQTGCHCPAGLLLSPSLRKGETRIFPPLAKPEPFIEETGPDGRAIQHGFGPVKETSSTDSQSILWTDQDYFSHAYRYTNTARHLKECFHPKETPKHSLFTGEEKAQQVAEPLNIAGPGTTSVVEAPKNNPFRGSTLPTKLPSAAKIPEATLILRPSFQSADAFLSMLINPPPIIQHHRPEQKPTTTAAMRIKRTSQAKSRVQIKPRKVRFELPSQLPPSEDLANVKLADLDANPFDSDSDSDNDSDWEEEPADEWKDFKKQPLREEKERSKSLLTIVIQKDREIKHRRAHSDITVYSTAGVKVKINVPALALPTSPPPKSTITTTVNATTTNPSNGTGKCKARHSRKPSKQPMMKGKGLDPRTPIACITYAPVKAMVCNPAVNTQRGSLAKGSLAKIIPRKEAVSSSAIGRMLGRLLGI